MPACGQRGRERIALEQKPRKVAPGKMLRLAFVDGVTHIIRKRYAEPRVSRIVIFTGVVSAMKQRDLACGSKLNGCHVLDECHWVYRSKLTRPH